MCEDCKINALAGEYAVPSLGLVPLKTYRIQIQLNYEGDSIAAYNLMTKFLESRPEELSIYKCSVEQW